jgi:pimeloyl-ACP methyl ester carboxylesterase
MEPALMSKSTLISLVVAAGLVYLGACLYLYLMQRSLMYFPTPSMDNVPAERLSIDSGGVRLALWRLHGGQRDAVLYFGGNAEDVALNIPDFDDWFAGCTVYLANYRGYGGSEGKPAEKDLYRDAVAVFDRLRAEHERVAVIGRSLGSGVATYLATERPVDRLALVTPAASFARLAGELYPLFPAGLMLKDRYDSLARADRLKVPVMILIAENDEIVPPAHSHDLAAAIDPSLVMTRVISNTEHNTVGSSPEYGAALRAFVCKPRGDGQP